MGFQGDKKLIHTKNKFETYLNSLIATEFAELDLNEEVKKDTIVHENKGSFLRKKHKESFDRCYYIWLNSK